MVDSPETEAFMAKVDVPLRVQTIERKLDDLSASVDNRFEQVDNRFEQVDKRFEVLEARMTAGFAAVDDHFAERRAYTEFGYTRLEQLIVGLSGRFDRFERKLDQIVDLHLLKPRPGAPDGRP